MSPTVVSAVLRDSALSVMSPQPLCLPAPPSPPFFLPARALLSRSASALASTSTTAAARPAKPRLFLPFPLQAATRFMLAYRFYYFLARVFPSFFPLIKACRVSYT